ncbi:ribonuclease BN [Geofilum rubicundum JCM 15548]|uniref:Ribonuclease BN n=1 Tax=Geofilum rubicundum JCM 15548 TaxID=1236989 RepID=A0A0E9LXH2_9BACT|nr:ribonuclease BN [Geofilum rubicundum JCM 15548]
MIVISEKVKAIQKFIEEDIWRMRKDNTSSRQFWVIRTFRIFVLAVKRFLIDDCMVKASALTYYSLLSVVPVVALAFAIAKGFGFRESLEEQLHNRLTGHEEVVQWVQEFALSYLDNTKGGMIAGVGVVILLFSVIKILSDIESSFNDIWDIKTARSMVRKFSDYISFMLVSTVLLVVSSSFMVFITNSIDVFNLGKIATPIIAWASPYLLIWVVFTMMFMLMPNTKVHFTSALFGGMVAGTLFLVVQFAYITFQVGMSKYNAIYGSFAALPLFLIWMNVSWLIVLLGAELSYAHQNEKSYEFDADTQTISDDYRRLVSLLVVKYVVGCFKNEWPAPSLSDLSLNLKLPIRLVSELIHKLKNSGILVEVNFEDNEKEAGYVPAFDIDKMTITCIVQKLEKSGASDFHFEETADYKTLRGILDEFNKVQIEMPANKLLRDL